MLTATEVRFETIEKDNGKPGVFCVDNENGEIIAVLGLTLDHVPVIAFPDLLPIAVWGPRDVEDILCAESDAYSFRDLPVLCRFFSQVDVMRLAFSN